MIVMTGRQVHKVTMMPTDLLSELTHEAVDSSRRRTRYVKAFISSLEAEGPGTDRRRIELTVREVVADTARRGVDGVRLWASLFELLRSRPTRSALVKFIADEVVELADAWMELEAQIRKLVKVGAQAGAIIDESTARELDDTARAIAKMKAEAAMIVVGLSRPRPETDPARLAQGLQDAAEGRTMKPDEVIAAIRAARE
jgi:predicted transcriptional regulator